VGLRASLDAMKKEKVNSLCQESNPGRPTPTLVTMLTDLPLLYKNISPVHCTWRFRIRLSTGL